MERLIRSAEKSDFEETMLKPKGSKALTIVSLFVFAIVTSFLSLGYLISIIADLSLILGLPLPIRLIGFFLIASSFFFLGWLFKYRKPLDIAVSTYITFQKAMKRRPLEERKNRAEPLIINGPYKYVRHPMYFVMVIFILG